MRLKPQRGASADPFMKSMTGFCLTSCRSRACRLPPPPTAAGGCTAAGAVAPPEAPGAAPAASAPNLAVRAAASAPSSRSATWPSRKNRKSGTTATPYASLMSAASSASTRSAATAGASAASWASTVSRKAQGSHQAAQKCTTAWGAGAQQNAIRWWAGAGRGMNRCRGRQEAAGLQAAVAEAATEGGGGGDRRAAAAGMQRTRRWAAMALWNSPSELMLCGSCAAAMVMSLGVHRAPGRAARVFPPAVDRR